MGRTVSSSRTVSAARSGSSARTAATQFRVPQALINLGVTHLISWRGGHKNDDPIVVYDDIGKVKFTYSGSSGVASIYTTGEYSADFNPANDDTFTGPGAPFPNRTNFSIMGFVKRDVASALSCLFSQWNANTSQFALILRASASNELEALTHDGTSSTLTSSSSGSVSEVGTWQAWGYTKAGTTATLSKNASRLSTSGTTRNTVNAATSNWKIGNFTNATPALASEIDGKIGLLALAFGKTWSASEELEVYNLLRILGNY